MCDINDRNDFLRKATDSVALVRFVRVSVTNYRFLLFLCATLGIQFSELCRYLILSCSLVNLV